MTSLVKAMFGTRSLSHTFIFAALFVNRLTFAFDNTRFDNLAVYWGQNSYGAVHSSDTANFQQRLSFYCGDDSTIDAFPVAFVNGFFSTGGLPTMNLANTCNPTDNATFPGTDLPDCSALAADVQACQAKGKIVTISLGGATGAVGFSSDSQAVDFANTVWDLFLGGSSSTRPFGDAVLDGVDLDIESGGSSSYVAFVNQIRANAAGASKTYYVTAAPQCPYPDAALGAVLNAADFDAVYVQFYNNVCGLNNFNVTSDWDFGLWDNWARNVSPNKNAKVYIGAPASSSAAGSGYLDASSLSAIAKQMRDSFPSFGGVMLWDASQAYANDRYDVAIKNALTAAGGTGFTFPACSAPAFASGSGYSGGAQVSYNGYIWEAKWFADDVPANDPNSDWSAISACSGGSSSPSSSSSSPSSSSSTPPSSSISAAPSSTSSSPSASPTSSIPSASSCGGIDAWSSGVAYTAGQQVSYNGHLWTANYWTESDPPNTTNGDWTDDGPCTAGAAAHLQSATSSFEPTSTFTISDTTEGALTSASFVSSSATSVTSAEIDASTSAKRVRSRFFQL